MISMNSNNLTLEFKASQLEKDLITTDRKELKELKSGWPVTGNRLMDGWAREGGRL